MNEAARSGAAKLTSRQIDSVIRATRAARRIRIRKPSQPDAAASPGRSIPTSSSPKALKFKQASRALPSPSPSPDPPASIFSQLILDEYAEVLRRRELGVRPGTRRQFLDLFRNRGRLVVPTRRIHAASDPDDNIFLECVEAARADYLITGNLRYFPTYWKQTKIITAAEFISLAAPHLLG